MSVQENVQLGTVRISHAGVAEMDQTRTVLFVAREDILRIELAFGSGAERPIVVGLLGVVVAGIATAMVGTFVLAVVRGGVKVPAALVAAVGFLIPAWWLLDLSLRRRWYLHVFTRTDKRKIVFQKTSNKRQIEEFVEEAKREFGYL